MQRTANDNAAKGIRRICKSPSLPRRRYLSRHATLLWGEALRDEQITAAWETTKDLISKKMNKHTTNCTANLTT